MKKIEKNNMKIDNQKYEPQKNKCRYIMYIDDMLNYKKMIN